MNYLAIFAVAIIAMLIGAIRYGPLLFGKQWMRLMGRTMNEREARKKQAVTGYVAMFIGLLVTATVISLFIVVMGITSWEAGLQLGFWLWIGITLPVLVGATLREGRNRGLFYISVSYQLIVLLMMGTLLAVR